MPRAIRTTVLLPLLATLSWLGAVAWLVWGRYTPGVQTTLVGAAATVTVIAYLEGRRIDSAETSRLALAAGRADLLVGRHSPTGADPRR